MTTQMLSSKEVELQRVSAGSLKLKVRQHDGDVATYDAVEVRLAFPLSNDKEIVSFRDHDGKEIALLKNAQELDQQSATALHEALQVAYFIPRVIKIKSIKEEFGVARWAVETDRGERYFDVQSRHDIRPVGKGRFLIRDVDGNRFEIHDVNALDPGSRSLLEMEI